MIFNQQHENKLRDYPTSIASIDGDELENVLGYRYLGCEIYANESNTGDNELNLRIDAGEIKFHSLAHHFLNQKINLKIRVNMLNSLVRSRIVHACPTWILSQVQMGKINAVYNRMLRKMIKGGFRRRENSWSYVLKNEDIIQMVKTITLESFSNIQQRNYAAHIVRK